METMKAVRIHEFGGPDKLRYEDVPVPEPGPGEVRVKVHAAGLNPVDWKIREGYFEAFAPHELPLTLGWDVSGVVESAGPGVKRFRGGEEVFAMADASRNGAYAEYIVMAETLLTPKPRSLDHVRAAAVPLAGLTAWHGLFKYGDLQKGQKVLIHGAAGGVGSFAVQLAKWKGAFVIGTASAGNLAYLKELGADRAIDYKATDFSKEVKDLDLVIDTVGGETLEKSWGVLKKGGILATAVAQPDQARAAALGVQGKYLGNHPNPDALAELARLLDAGKLHVVAETLPLAEARKAHERSQAGHVRGKLVLKVA